MEISKDLLNGLFEYKDGKLFHKPRSAEVFANGVVGAKRHNARLAGKQAGHVDKASGYVRVGVKGVERGTYKSLLGHRVVWQMVYGEIPSGMEIDHINGNRSDNRIENLRIVTPTENARNHGISKRNKSGVVGVCWDSSRSEWEVKVGSKRIGRYKSKEDAIAARKDAEAKKSFHPNHGERPAYAQG